MELLRELERFSPWNAQEARDREALLCALREGTASFTRENARSHFTASAWVVSPDRAQVLMVHHNLYRSWSWIGGHADGETDLLAVAMREVREESGVTTVRAVSPDIYAVEVLAVAGHEKHGEFLSSHLHLNVTYLLEADPREAVRCKIDENSRVGWFDPEEAVRMSVEPWFRERIYRKLIDKREAFESARKK
ncbi:MAG: NUDIX hydrolase [Oscillibacter sp.]|nr:NUDIX hydrolase [Oscillibacter sp.]